MIVGRIKRNWLFFALVLYYVGPIHQHKQITLTHKIAMSFVPVAAANWLFAMAYSAKSSNVDLAAFIDTWDTVFFQE